MKNSKHFLELEQTSPISCMISNWPADTLIPDHFHPTSQLIYAAKGVITVETANGFWVVPPNRAVWVPREQLHSVATSGDVILITVQFSSEVDPTPDGSCCVVLVSALLRECMLRLSNVKDNYKDDSPQSRLAQVILDELKTVSVMPFEIPMPSDKRAKFVATSIRTDPSQRLSLKEWANNAGASERTLARLFKTQTGMSFGVWQQQARMLKALQILATGTSVTDAAAEVGFQSISAFITAFRKVMGFTPSKYFDKSITATDLEVASNSKKS